MIPANHINVTSIKDFLDHKLAQVYPFILSQKILILVMVFDGLYVSESGVNRGIPPKWMISVSY